MAIKPKIMIERTAWFQKNFGEYLYGFFLAAAMLYAAALYWSLGSNMILNGDDFAHMNISGLNTFTHAISTDFDLRKVFWWSFGDAHPPLRNLIFALWLPHVTEMIHIRMPFMAAGVLFLCATSFALAELGISRSVRLLMLVFLVHAKQMVILSIETRGYIFMLLFLTLAIGFLLRYRKTGKNTCLIAAIPCALLAVFAEYSGFFTFCIFLTVHFLFDVRFTERQKEHSAVRRPLVIALPGSKNILLFKTTRIRQIVLYFAYFAPASILIFLFRENYYLSIPELFLRIGGVAPVENEFFSNPIFAKESLEVIAHYVGLLQKTFFNFFYFQSSAFVTITGFLAVCGLTFFFIERKYYLFTCSVLTVFCAVFLDMIGKYPLTADRRTIFLLPVILMAIAKAVDEICTSISSVFARRCCFTLIATCVILSIQTPAPVTRDYLLYFFRAQHWYQTMSPDRFMAMIFHITESRPPEERLHKIVFIQQSGASMTKSIFPSKVAAEAYFDPMKNLRLETFLGFQRCARDADECVQALRLQRAKHSLRSVLYEGIDAQALVEKLAHALQENTVQPLVDSERSMQHLLSDAAWQPVFWLRHLGTFRGMSEDELAGTAVFLFQNKTYEVEYFPHFQIFRFRTLTNIGA